MLAPGEWSWLLTFYEVWLGSILALQYLRNWEVPIPSGPQPVPKALGRGAGDEHEGKGRKEAALLGELMGVSGEH